MTKWAAPPRAHRSQGKESQHLVIILISQLTPSAYKICDNRDLPEVNDCLILFLSSPSRSLREEDYVRASHFWVFPPPLFRRSNPDSCLCPEKREKKKRGCPPLDIYKQSTRPAPLSFPAIKVWMTWNLLLDRESLTIRSDTITEVNSISTCHLFGQHCWSSRLRDGVNTRVEDEGVRNVARGRAPG